MCSIGFLADDEKSFAEQIDRILNLSVKERFEIISNAREKAKEFSEHQFEIKFIERITKLIDESFNYIKKTK